MNVPAPDKPLARRLLLAAIVLVAVLVRLGPRDDLLAADGILFSDLDTMRRLARIEALDQAASYPAVEARDGWPDGSTLHWTLPMDHVIRGLDLLAGWAIPRERGYEGGAVLAGPVLAALAVLAFALLAGALLGPRATLFAALFYALGHSFVATSLLGNGDHQTLQQLAAVVAVFGLLRALHGTAAAGSTRAFPWPLLAGAALGFSVWVSTELMLLFYVLALALTVLQALPQPDVGRRTAVRRVTEQWSGGVLAMALVGHLVESRQLGALHWDVVSSFQVWQIATFAAFAAGLRRLGARPGLLPVAAAGMAALALGLLPLLLSPAVRAALDAQLANAAEVNVWLKMEVSEFRSLFAHGFGALPEREGWLPFLLVAALPGLRWSPLAGPAAVALGVTAAGACGLYAWEVKLGHLYALTFPLVLVAGWLGLARRLAFAGQQWLHAVAAALVVWSLLAHLPPPRAPWLRNNDRIVREICAKIASRQQDEPGAVLAPWDMGAPLLYHTRAGVVATGYHRNLEGIRDGFRFWLTDARELPRAIDILRRRRVRWVVAWHDRLFFLGGARTLGIPPLRTETELLPAAQQTVFWKLRHASLPGFQLVADGPEIRKPGSPPEPVYRLFEVQP